MKAWTLDETRAGAAEIVVNHADRGESERARGLGQAILATLALGVLRHLAHGRLTDIDHCAAPEVISGDLRAHAGSPLSWWDFDRRVPRSAGRPVPRSDPRACAPRGAAVPYLRGPTRAVVVIGLSSVPSSAAEEANDPSSCGADEVAVSKTRSSFRASIATRGEPADIAAHIAASHIQAGTSRETPARDSTYSPSSPPRLVRW